MRICSTCGRENADDVRICSNCGSPLASGVRAREERKVVTVLFADLVGFTSPSERLDPEDVRATLTPYFARLREELERRGGTVEKFIGDAVMAVFGAPAAHEDDPERAVRAGLAIRDAISEMSEQDPELDLHVRIGINTGEALVSFGADPSKGEGMAAGDVVNTAARLQAGRRATRAGGAPTRLRHRHRERARVGHHLDQGRGRVRSVHARSMGRGARDRRRGDRPDGGGSPALPRGPAPTDAREDPTRTRRSAGRPRGRRPRRGGRSERAGSPGAPAHPRRASEDPVPDRSTRGRGDRGRRDPRHARRGARDGSGVVDRAGGRDPVGGRPCRRDPGPRG